MPEYNPHGATGGSNAGPSKIVGSQAKKQEDVTRQGTQKMKFIPTLPVRRKKPDSEVKREEAPPPPVPKPTERGRGRGQGSGRGLGRGRGGPPAPRPEAQMTASGPFAMGPALAGSSKKRTPRSNFIPAMPMGLPTTSGGEGLSRSGPPTLRGDQAKASVKEEEEDIEVYSDPDEGVQIVDMDAIKTMDWMAPESLKRERTDVKKNSNKKNIDVKPKTAKEKGKAKEVKASESEVETKNLANALDLSESEPEEEMEDLMEDFAMDHPNTEEEDSLTRQEKLYFFQFPQPFPTFFVPDENEVAAVDLTADNATHPVVDGPKGEASDKEKKVSFAPDVKPPQGSLDDQGKAEGIHGSAPVDPGTEKRLDGVIGQLEVHRSGIIKMRLNNGMVMDVTAATQPSFLQHAVFLDPTAKKLHVLGEVNRRFVVSPDVDKLLEEMERVESAERIKAENAAVPMDIT